MTGVVLLAGCGGGEDAALQPLPPVRAPSDEARLGLPEVGGDWRFAGWELAPGDSADLAASLPAFGTLRLTMQRRDSVAGSYVGSGGGEAPLVGEVRRDSVVALVAGAGGGMRYLAGRLGRDTLWLELSSLVEPGSWPAGARAAFTRGQAGERFVRIQGAPPPPPAVDTAAALAAAARAESALAQAQPAPPPPPAARSVSPRPQAPPAVSAQPARPPAAAPPEQQIPRPGAARPQPQAQPAQPRTPPAALPPEQQVPEAQPQPQPEPEAQPPRKPHLLGRPVERDTTGRDSGSG